MGIAFYSHPMAQSSTLIADARRLLASTRLSCANIVAFVDSNAHWRGQKLAGRDILGPDQLAGRPEAIVICSAAFEHEIAATIRHKLGLANRILSI
jgi:hypothetical protein